MLKNLCKTIFIIILLFSLTSHAFNPQTPYRSIDVHNFEQVRHNLDNPYKLYNYINANFKYESDTRFSNVYDYWQTAEDMFYRQTGDCEDWAEFTRHVLDYHGYKAYWVGGKYAGGGHAICMYEWNNEWYGIGNTHTQLEAYGSLTNLNMTTIYSNAGFTSISLVYTNGPPANKLQYDNLVQTKFVYMDRVEPQTYVSAVKFYGRQQFSVDFKYNNYVQEKDKLSTSIMYRPDINNNKSIDDDHIAYGLSYSIHGFYLDMNDKYERKYLNHIVYGHLKLFNRLGITAYYDLSMLHQYYGIDVDVKVIDYLGHSLFGTATKIEGYIAFRNVFQVIDIDIRTFFTRQFYVYAMKRDRHLLLRFHYEPFKRTKNTWLYTMITPGFYIDTDYNAGLFLNGQRFTGVFSVKGNSIYKGSDFNFDKFVNSIKVNSMVTIRF